MAYLAPIQSPDQTWTGPVTITVDQTWQVIENIAQITKQLAGDPAPDDTVVGLELIAGTALAAVELTAGDVVWHRRARRGTALIARQVI